MTETLANGYSSESTQQELSNEYQHDRVQMFFKNLCIPVLWMKVASALEGLNGSTEYGEMTDTLYMFSYFIYYTASGWRYVSMYMYAQTILHNNNLQHLNM